MSMTISFKLLDSSSDISRKILISLRDYLRPIMQNVGRNINQSIIKDVAEAIKAEPEYMSLLSGVLRSELGIPDAAQRIERLLDAWSNSAVFTANPVTITGTRLSGGFSLNMIRSDFSDILGLSDATITDDISGSSIEWLRWLLLEGGKTIIIRNYEVSYPGSNSRSRTGNAVMIQSKKNWKIPAAFAGDVKNNWITRAIDRLDSTILSKLQQELESKL